MGVFDVSLDQIHRQFARGIRSAISSDPSMTRVDDDTEFSPALT